MRTGTSTDKLVIYSCCKVSSNSLFYKILPGAKYSEGADSEIRATVAGLQFSWWQDGSEGGCVCPNLIIMAARILRATTLLERVNVISIRTSPLSTSVPHLNKDKFVQIFSLFVNLITSLEMKDSLLQLPTRKDGLELRNYLVALYLRLTYSMKYLFFTKLASALAMHYHNLPKAKMVC